MNANAIRLVIVFLGTVCCLCVVGIIVSSALGRDPHATLGTIASMAGGALTGILATPKSRRRRSFRRGDPGQATEDDHRSNDHPFTPRVVKPIPQSGEPK